MNMGNWRIYAALGGLIFLIGLMWGGWKYWNYRLEHTSEREYAAENDIGPYQKSREKHCALLGISKSDCVIVAPDPETIDEHTKADLKAQQDVAEWSFLTMLISGLGVVLSALAVAFTGWAAWAAAAAAKAARQSVADSRNASEQESERFSEQLTFTRASLELAAENAKSASIAADAAVGQLKSNRAWITHKLFESHPTKPSGGRAIYLTWENTGASPALKVRVSIDIERTGCYDPVPVFPKAVNSSQIQLSAAVGTGCLLHTQMKALSPKDIELLQRQEMKYYFFSRIEYNDIYETGIMRVSESCFLIHHVGTEIDAKGVVGPKLIALAIGEQNSVT